MRMFTPAIGTLAIVAAGPFVLSGCMAHEPRAEAAADFGDAAYVIEGRLTQLRGGVAEIPAAPGSASKVITRYFGDAVVHDLNGDGREDVVFLLTQDTGGSGTFFYVVAALGTPKGYVGSQGLLLGDRIAPQTLEIGADNVVTVNYRDRAPGESFATPPSQTRSVRLSFDTVTLRFAAQR